MQNMMMQETSLTRKIFKSKIRETRLVAFREKKNKSIGQRFRDYQFRSRSIPLAYKPINHPPQ